MSRSGSATIIWSKRTRSARDPAQERVVKALDHLLDDARRQSAGAQIEFARLAVRQKAGGGVGQRALHPWRGRPRQDHADGSVLRTGPDAPQTPRPFQRFHGRSPRPHPKASPGAQGRQEPRGRSDPAGGQGDCRRDPASLLRRVHGDRHRRRDDPVAAVFRAFRQWRGAGRHVERRSRRPLPRRPQPGAVPALHRDTEAACRCDQASIRIPTTGWRSSAGCRSTSRRSARRRTG